MSFLSILTNDLDGRWIVSSSTYTWENCSSQLYKFHNFLVLFFLNDVVRSGHLFLQTIVMFMLKVFMWLLHLRNYCGNTAELLSALFSWTYSFTWRPKNSYFSLGLCVSHQCCSPGVVNTPSALITIWPNCASLSPWKLGKPCDLLWPMKCEWEGI